MTWALVGQLVVLMIVAAVCISYVLEAIRKRPNTPEDER